ncbi:MAG: DUF3341 domain-containing protein [Ignavibacteriales bacterium]|nr:hypothetical protein [Ignavibacteriaceae bacterium]QOJ29198.1 MAG: DUF3341 domain-containing protein [Ignavibacteriales bacterium]
MERTNKLFAVTALFNTPNEIISAAAKTAEKGYTKFDVHTPYPVHGMDRAMQLEPSKLGFITLAFGLSGTGLALMLAYWTMNVDYPMNIGGKPLFAFPAYVPVLFEVTVLLATLATVIGMLTFFFKFPSNSHPVHDTDFMKAVSLDKFGVIIESEDPLFNEEDAVSFLSSIGGTHIERIYYPVKETYPVLDKKFIGLQFTIALVVSGLTYVTLNKVVYLEPFTWMSAQFKSNVQSSSTFFADGRTMRTPVSGTVARGYMPYEFAGLTTQPENPLSNPFSPSKAFLEKGKKKYETFCSPCHGNYGDGDSRLREQFPNPPSLHSEKIRTWKDGNIYHVIVNGQNVMPSYSAQLNDEERWAITSYIRVLQKAKNSTEDDVKLVRKEISSNVAQ